MLSSFRAVKPRFAPVILLGTVLLNTAYGAADAAGPAASKVSKSAPATTAPTQFNNPIIKTDSQDPTSAKGPLIYTADPAALVHDGTLYLYTTHDEQTAEGKDYRMYDYRLWTSTDLVRWQNQGAVLRYSDFAWARGDAKTGS